MREHFICNTSTNNSLHWLHGLLQKISFNYELVTCIFLCWGRKKNWSQHLAKNQVSGKFFRSLNLDWVWIRSFILETKNLFFQILTFCRGIEPELEIRITQMGQTLILKKYYGSVYRVFLQSYFLSGYFCCWFQPAVSWCWAAAASQRIPCPLTNHQVRDDSKMSSFSILMLSCSSEPASTLPSHESPGERR